MTSTRLPGKVLADVAGEPMLALLLRRLSLARCVGAIVVATSEDPADATIAELALELGFGVHRGSLQDVLGRMAGAAAGHEGPVVRITADCPLTDAQTVDDVVGLLQAHPGAAYASNIEPRTYPDGLDVEVLPASVLRELDATVADPHEREHVTLHLRRRPQRWPPLSLPCEVPGIADLRWTVDTQEDLDFVRALVSRLGDARHSAGLGEMLTAARWRGAT
ncbi:MAG: NTP transferase domain-containing protein [Solirubrobacterales bacterium]|nr:NTP transferase domain-containing protein [Solirubrobacterales bacterium]